MPNYKIFQDIPQNLKTKLYGEQSGTTTALQMESGALAVGLYGQQSGSATSLQMESGALAVGLYASQSGTVSSLEMESGALSVGLFAEQSGTVSSLQMESGALAVGLYALQSGTVTSLQMESGMLVVTQAASTMDSGPAYINFTSGADSGTTIWTVLDYSEWTLAVSKQSGDGSGQVRLELSATGSGGDWYAENGSFETITSGSWKYYVAQTYLKYARIAVQESTNSGNVGLRWYFQGRKIA